MMMYNILPTQGSQSGADRNSTNDGKESKKMWEMFETQWNVVHSCSVCY